MLHYENIYIQKFVLRDSRIYICTTYKIVIITIVLKYSDLEALNKLREYDIKPSMQRLAIMEYLLNNHLHPSVEDIYSSLYPTMPTLSKTTIYNTLKLFEEHHAVRTLTIDEKNVCYDIDTTPHAHFICKSCNKIEDFEAPLSLSLEDKLKFNGYLVTESHFYYKGVCKKCLDTQKIIINNN